MNGFVNRLLKNLTMLHTFQMPLLFPWKHQADKETGKNVAVKCKHYNNVNITLTETEQMSDIMYN